MFKLKVKWTGFSGAPGWSNFYFNTTDGTFADDTQATAAADKVSTFLNAIKVYLPPTVNLQLQSDSEFINEGTGEMLRIGNVGARAAVVGGAVSQPYSSATGMVINWRTAGVRNGRRVRGRTFLVPTVAGAFQNDGTIDPGNVTSLTTSANALISVSPTLKLGVWTRPSTKGGSDGKWFETTVATIPDMTAVLRSRRD
jgi:hypothetical protein